MITSVHYKPHIWSPAYNPIMYSFTSDKNTQVDFTYVVDIYVNEAVGSATYTRRLKQRPNPAGACMIDISPIVTPFIDLSNYSAEEGWSLRYRNSDEIAASVYIKVGEEYAGPSGGATAIYDGNGSIGEPAYTIYSQEFEKPVRVIPAALDYQDSQANLAATGAYGYFAPYVMDDNGKFLKRDSNSISVRASDRHTLSFLNWYDGPTGASTLGSIQLMQISEYGATGLIATTNYYNQESNGGGPQLGSNYTTVTESITTDVLTFRCGPGDLSLDPSTTYYTVTAYIKTTPSSSASPQTVASETVTFTLDTECQDLYPVVRLSWLNDLGGRDYYNFDMFYELTSVTEGDTYYQTPINWSSTTPVAVDGSADQTGNWLRGGNKSYNPNVVRTFSIQSDWLTQEYVDFLGGIAESSSVWAYIGDNPIPFTVQITNSEYTYKNIKQTKLVQASFDCQITKLQQKQNM